MKKAARVILCFWTLALIPTAVTSVFGADLTVTQALLDSFAGQNNIVLQATDNVIFTDGAMSLAALAGPGQLTVQAGNSIIIQNDTSLTLGSGWSLSMVAGTGFVPSVGQPTPPSGSAGIYLDGNAFIQGNTGNLSLTAANEVQVGWADSASSGANAGIGSITTTTGGSIAVTTQYGDVNAGSNPQGYLYRSTAPYYAVSLTLGGISTAAGGSVAINAGGNVFSYLPYGSSAIADAGTGAFGSHPGNVTITAGGNVYGHYVLANGVGTITAGNNIGAQSGPDAFSLSLIAGSWNVAATNGSLYLQEVRNPNGVFNGQGRSSGAGYHRFDYDPQAAVTLTAGGVNLTGLNPPRPNGASIPVCYPPTLNLSAGSGGVTLQGDVTLFPSASQNLHITTTGGGDLRASSPPGSLSPFMLYMSDSSQTKWLNSATFGVSDHASVPNNLNNANPVVLEISGNMENLDLITSEATHITVGGNLLNCGFSGQNLHSSDVSYIDVAGKIFNQGAYAFVTLTSDIPSVPAANLPSGRTISWDNVLTLAVDPATIATLTVPANLSASQLAAYAMQMAALFPSGNPGFSYNPATRQLGFAGRMSLSILSELSQPITVLRLDANGVPVVANGNFVTDTLAWVNPSQLQTLYTASQANLSPFAVQLGYRLGGPGQFNIHAGSISLGNTYGLLSCGVADSAGGFSRYANLASLTPSGAALNVTVSGHLDLSTSTIAAMGGGNVNVTSAGGSMELGLVGVSLQQRPVGYGIFTSGTGNVSVLASGDIDLSGSTIATYNGGNIFIETLQGNVNAGTGGTMANNIGVSYVNPATGTAGYYQEQVFGSGIVACTLIVPASVPNSADIPGNITVETPHGNITDGPGGIGQWALNGNTPAGPTITLIAGTPGTNGTPGNIHLGESGVVGGTVNLTASGDITGMVISRQNCTINVLDNFSGTVLSGGSANVSAGGTSSGVIFGAGGALASGDGILSFRLLSQDASTNGGPSQYTFGFTALAGSSIQFTPPVLDGGSLNWQWSKNGTSLPGETNASLSLTNVHRTDSATYSFVVSNLAAAVMLNYQLRVLTPQILKTSFLPASNALAVSFRDAAGGLLTAQDIPSFVIQTSTNFVDWTSVDLPITTNADGGLFFTLPADSLSDRGFYRIQSQ